MAVDKAETLLNQAKIVLQQALSRDVAFAPALVDSGWAEREYAEKCREAWTDAQNQNKAEIAHAQMMADIAQYNARQARAAAAQIQGREF